MTVRVAIFGLTGLLFSSAAAAQGVSLDWKAPSSCPDADAVGAAIERRLGRALDEVVPPLRVEATVTSTRAGYRLLLRTGGSDRSAGQRRLEAPTCRELADAAALIVALAIDPDAARAHGSEEPVLATGAEAEGETRTAQAEPQPDAEQARQDDDSETEERETEADIVDAPPAEDLFDFDDAAPLAFGGYARAALLGDHGSLPGVGAGPALGVGVSLSALRIELTGVWLPARDVQSDARSLPVGELSLLSAGLGVCYTEPEPTLRLSPCLRAEYGRVTGGGSANIAQRAEVDAPFGLISALLELGVPLTGALFAQAEVGVGLPVVQTVFTVGDVGKVHRIGGIVIRAGLGLSLEL